MKLKGGNWGAEDINDMAYWQMLSVDEYEGGVVRIHTIKAHQTHKEFRFIWWDVKELGELAETEQALYYLYRGLEYIYVRAKGHKATVVNNKSGLVKEGVLLGYEPYHDSSFKVRVRFKTWGWFHKDCEYLG